MKKLMTWFFLLMLSLTPFVTQAESDILLGAGDVLKISVFEQPDLSLEVRVSESGAITYPLIGEVRVGGGTVAAAEQKIASLLEKGGFLKNAHVNIIVAQLQSLQVSILGQVNRPGRYPIDSAKTLADVLALAGGVSPEGGDLITLVHNVDGRTVRDQIDLAEMMRTGDLSKNIHVAGGDIVYVERFDKFYIYGQVQRASHYRLEHEMTVLQALSVGGGLSPRGTEKGVKIKRRNADGQIEIISAKHDDLIKPNDVIYVQESFF
ncbi:polysaccharide export protein EpsE [Methylobacillus flagellatus]|uniref:polysaccharide export protein EpsE n=1 Tax=Methylobacillus flagellatus TaxID=405 RepID=UPI002853DF2B|nr:polysaccharide export protein EpsE [Methylobacillus flagellatus]MDR5172649.1 polysaccharide export protein EpsE [Methylobacillus flagellatus]